MVDAMTLRSQKTEMPKAHSLKKSHTLSFRSVSETQTIHKNFYQPIIHEPGMRPHLIPQHSVVIDEESISEDDYGCEEQKLLETELCRTLRH